VTTEITSFLRRDPSRERFADRVAICDAHDVRIFSAGGQA
jgi:hypothetical protein